MLLELEDLGDEWTRISFAGDYGDHPFDPCISGEAPSAKAKTGDFTHEFSGSVSEHALIFSTEADAVSALAQIDDRASCLVDLIESGGLDTSTATFTDPRREDVETLKFGDGAAAFRVITEGDKEGGLITEATLYYDFVYVVVGRALIVIFAQDYAPFETTDLEDVTQIAVELAAGELDVTVTDPRGDRPSETNEPEPTDAEEPTDAPSGTQGRTDARDNPIPLRPNRHRHGSPLRPRPLREPRRRRRGARRKTSSTTPLPPAR